MKVLQRSLSLLLTLLFIPSPAALASNMFQARAMMSNGGSGASADSGGSGNGGAGGGSGTGGGITPGQSEAQRAANAYNRSVTAVDAMRRAQAAARGQGGVVTNPNNPGVALPGVTDGLSSGGLIVADGAATNPALWQGAQLPGQQTGADGKVIVTVKQDAAQALLTWQQLNVGTNTILHFDQSAGGADSGNWTAFNRVSDPSGSPTQILGQIKAEGQVYIINPNGIVFGSDSQVDVRGLTASALPINWHLVENGLLNNPDSQFLFSALAQPAGANGTPAFTPEAPSAALGRYGDVLVMAGARLNSLQSADGGGGRIMLVGPNVRNHGTISTPGGQTILAAGLQVGVAAHASSDASLRGLDVYIGAIAAAGTPQDQVYAGHALNAGLIESMRGNTTMAGSKVELTGVIDSSTSVALNGRVDLNASYGAISNPLASGATQGDSYQPFLNSQSGSVLIGAESVIRILPEIDSLEKVAASQLQLRSQVNLRGKTIYMGEDSMILAPNAIINADAGVWKVRQAGNNRVAEFVNADGHIYLDNNALISAAGTTNVVVPISQVLLTVELRGAELADSPVQRDDILRGETITVDIRKTGTLDGVDWVGSPIADVSGYLGLIERTVAELTTAGGEVNLNAGGSIVMQQGAEVDVSGGWVRYEGGSVRTTKLLQDGRLIDIADASPDVKYDGVYNGVSTSTSSYWNVTKTYMQPFGAMPNSYDPGYTQGAAGGKLTLTASSMVLDGSLRGTTVTGERQASSHAPHATLTLAFETRDVAISADKFPVTAPDAPMVSFVNGEVPAAAGASISFDAAGNPVVSLPQERAQEVALSADLLGSDGFGNVTVRNRGGDVTVGQGVEIVGQRGGALALEGANVTVDGSVSIAGGSIDLSAYNVSYERINQLELRPNPTNPVPEAGRGTVSLGDSAVLSTAGMVVDAREGAATPQAYALNGGRVSVRGFNTELAAGSVIDVSGGLRVSPTSGISYGNGGSIVLEGGRDLAVTSVLGGSLAMNGTLLGYSGAKGGSLSLLAPVVEVGGTGVHADALLLSPEFFNQGGFSDFTIRGIGAKTAQQDVYVPGVTIADGTLVRPEVTTLRATLVGDGIQMDQVQLEEGVRAPSSITFGATGARDPYASQVIARGEVLLGEGATVQTDAGGSVTFDANAVTLLGSVVTPGGTITVRGGNNLDRVSQVDDHAQSTVYIGENARLLAQGKTVHTFNADGLRTGKVHAGGAITVSGNIVAAQGAVLDVSGTSGVLDLRTGHGKERLNDGSSGLGAYVPVQIDTAGGTITLAGSELLASDATLIGNAGGSDAVGGTLKVSSGRFYRDSETSTTADITLSVVQDGQLLDNSGTAAARAGQTVYDANGNRITGGGRFAADSFEQGGFNNLNLGGNVAFTEAVTIEARGSIRVADGGVVQSTGAPVTLKAGHVAIGQNFAAPQDPSQRPFLFTQNIPGTGEREYKFTPTHGSGTLNVEAGSIDIGTLSLAGIGRAEFVTGNTGSIRGNGSLNIAGDLVLEAGQVHPTTATAFTVTAFDYQQGGATQAGSIIFRGGNPALALPYSAGGTLSAYASVIQQEGTLRAPFGAINLGWDGTGTAPLNAISGTAMPVASSVRLADGSVTSVSGVGPDGKGISLPYGVLLNGISWIDPRGVDITLGGLPQKQVNLSGKDIATEEGSLIDLRGGGDLFAYRWTPGVGGTRDILASSGSFAVVPGYAGSVAAAAPYNPAPVGDSLGGDAGYTNSGLKAGDQVYLSADSGLPAGIYTLLPARYALMEGAFLITPKGQQLGGNASAAMADGSRLVSGYRVDGLSGTAQNGTAFSLFEVASRDVVLKRAQYDIYSANTFLAAAAADRQMSVPRLPGDSGQLVFTASREMELRGSLSADAIGTGRGSLVDINSALDIIISDDGGSVANALMLDVDTLNAFGAASLLVGGVRDTSDGVSQVSVSAGNVTLANSQTALSGSDIILVGKNGVTLADGSLLVATAAQSGTAATADPVRIGNSAAAGSGNSALVRVSSATDAVVERVGVSSGNSAVLSVGADALVQGGSVTLDSSAQTQLDSQAQIHATALNLGSGKISLVLDDAGGAAPADGLILSGDAMASILASAKSLGLSSYSSIDVYGNGTVGSSEVERLALNAPSLRAFGNAGGEVSFVASQLLLQNTTGTTTAPVPGNLAGSVRFEGSEVQLGKGVMGIDGFAATTIAADGQVRLSQTGGITTVGDLTLVTPKVIADTAADHTLNAGGAFALERPAQASASAAAVEADLGLGAKLKVEGEQVALGSNVILPSGEFVARARTGDVTVGTAATGAALVDVAGRARNFYDKTAATDAGSVTLAAAAGNVVVGTDAVVDVSAPVQTGGKAGTVAVQAANGGLQLQGQLKGQGASGGVFDLDAARLLAADGSATQSLAGLDAALNAGGFDGARSYRVRTGDVRIDGTAKAAHYAVSADAGSITASGRVDASGVTGGQIELRAADDVIIENGAVLTVAAQRFDNAGKGGKVFLEAGSQTDGVVNQSGEVAIRSGSLIDLSVAAKTAQSAAQGQHSGVLHLRAAQNAAGTDMGIAAIEGEIRGASHIVAEGYKLYDLTGTDGTITTAIQNAIRQDGTAFLGAAGTANAQYRAMLERISGGNAQMSELILLQAGAEVINREGDLALGNANTTATADWDLSGYRFGERGTAGVLTLRASGDIVFHNALSDGFAGGSSLWLAPLMAQNANLPANAQSWSYRLSSGADVSAADYRRVQDVADLATGKGSLLLGKNAGAATASGGNNALTSSLITRYFQVIRTGSGDIDITAGRDVMLLNPFASIYTAGTAVANPTSLYTAGDFSLPVLRNSGVPLSQGSLGVLQQDYPVQYSHSGGNVSIVAGGDIGRYTRDATGKLVVDSSRQLPTNWLYRRGYVDDAGNYGRVYVGSGLSSVTDTDASTSWWVDFSNFFQSVGALGGGNVSMVAGRDIINVDAVIPTNARAPKGAPDASKIVELGGGDLTVRAGNDISGGIYYVERGEGALHAGNEITTNAARSINRNIIQSLASPVYEPEETWLPTTLFLGKGEFNVSAIGDVTLGPVANAFLLPQGVGNRYWYKTYFNTYAPQSAVNVASAAGDITLRNTVTMADTAGAQPFLQVWLARQNLLVGTGTNNAAYYQPWLRLAESAIDPFASLLTVLPPSLRATSFSGDISLSGTFNLFPSATGTLDLLSAGSIHGLSANGVSDRIILGQRVASWSTSSINLSDANPALLPGVTNPFNYHALVGSAVANNNSTRTGFLQSVNRFFEETGALNSVLQTQQALHSADILHRNDPDPVYVYAAGGDISGLTLFSAKPARLIAGRDIADINLYLQNLNSGQMSLVSAGRDIVAYQANSARRLEAMSAGNAFNTGQQAALGGDIQLGGPGSLYVLAGRDLDLGVGPNGSNGLAAGITTIGNRRNPFLPAQGADVIAGAGIGLAQGLRGSDLDFDAFIQTFLDPATGGILAVRYLEELAWLLDTSKLKNAVWDVFGHLDAAEQQELAKQVLHLAQANKDAEAVDSATESDPAFLAAFIRDYLNPSTGGVRAERYLKELGKILTAEGATYTAQSDPYLDNLKHLLGDGAWADFNARGDEPQARFALDIFYMALRDAGRDYNNPDAATRGTYTNGELAIAMLFPEPQQGAGALGSDGLPQPSRWSGDISLTSRQIKTAAGGDISLFAPGGGLVVGFPIASARADQGVLTEAGGNINIFTRDDVSVGSSRIFTLRGGDIMIWSSKGDIAAGSAARTVSSAPPTRVIIDTQTASVQTDLSGLATGGGIGVLQTVASAISGNVNLIAPEGSVDAGDAGIRVSGNINIAAVEVVNASNIQAGGSAAGVPVAAPSVNIASLASSSSTQAATAGMDSVAAAQGRGADGRDGTPSMISVEVLGYGDEDEDDRRRPASNQAASAAATAGRDATTLLAANTFEHGSTR